MLLELPSRDLPTRRGGLRVATACVSVILAFAGGCTDLLDPCIGFDADDGNACTVDACELVGGEPTAVHTPVECGAQLCDPRNGQCVACLVAADCGDDDPCTVDACDEVGACTRTDLDCDDGDRCTIDTCDPPAGCVNTPDDGTCDDGAFCNGAESCSVDGCLAGVPPCAEGQACAEAEDACVPACETTEDCPDSDLFCAIVTCTEGACLTTTRSCDDGVFCNGTETCNEETDACDHSGDRCTGELFLCEEGTNTCIHIDPCSSDADCPDDGLFCNGVESCSAEGLCVSSGDPCFDPDPCKAEVCNEDVDGCYPGLICEPPDIDLTLGVDTYSGTQEDDMFRALLAFNAPTGTSRPTLQTGDSVDGLAGEDVLSAQFDAGSTNMTIEPTLISLEVWQLSDFGMPGGGATTLSAVQSSGVHQITSVNSTDDAVIVTNLRSLVDLSVIRTASDLRVAFISPATDAASDALILILDEARTGCTVAITTPLNGVEIIDIVSEGSVANVLDALTQVTGRTLATVTISGEQDLTISAPLDDSVVTVNAVAFEGDLTVTAGTLAVLLAGGLGSDVLTGSAQADSIDGDDGNDKLIGRGGGDNLIGGSGANTYRYQQTSDGGAPNADNVGMDLIQGFVLGTGGDVLTFQDGVFFADGSILDLDIITGAATGNVTSGFTDGSAGAAQVIVQTTPLTNFAAVETLFTSLDTVMTSTTAVVIAEVSGAGTFVFWDPDTSAVAGERVLGRLVGLTGTNLAGLVAANLAINDG